MKTVPSVSFFKYFQPAVWFRFLLVLTVFSLPGGQTVSDNKKAFEPIVIQIAYMYHFMKFVDWPVDFKPQNGQPYNLCAVTRIGNLQAFETIAQKKVSDNPIKVLFKTTKDEFSDCHLVFVSGLDKSETRIILDKLKARPTLTVGTSNRFLDMHGMIQFRVSLGQVTFSVDLKAVNKANLSISANMLDVAEKVRK